jgi:hypothetical protein
MVVAASAAAVFSKPRRLMSADSASISGAGKFDGFVIISSRVFLLGENREPTLWHKAGEVR